MKKRMNGTPLLFLAFLFLFSNNPAEVAKNQDSTEPMAGISNHGRNKEQPYVAAGDRTYIIGTQDGNFPDMGQHVQGEMGGLWLHPIKLMDGFWAKVTDANNGDEFILSEAGEFINYPYGNRFKYAPMPGGLETERFQFCPDGQQGMVIQYMLKNITGSKRDLKFEIAVKTDLSPVWFSDQLGVKDSRDHATWDAEKNVFVGKDRSNPWFVVWGATHPSSKQSIGKVPLQQKTLGKGVAAALTYDLSIDKNSSVTLTFLIAGSAKNRNEAINAYRNLAKNHAALLEEKKKHYAAVLERARIRIPDQRLQEVYDWVKVNTEWLVREVPGIGRGLGGGLMEYPWWFGTETYSLQALMATGDFDLPKQTLYLLKNQSMKKNGNGRIVHEITTNGAISNPGNTQETAQFILTAGKLFKWTGDLEFAKEMYPMMKMGINWLLSDMDQNRNLFPEGYGIMEVYGLNAELIDVAVYTQQALEATAYIAGVLKEPEEQSKYQQLASELARRINENLWDQLEGSYCDFYGSRAQAIQATKGAIVQIGRNSAQRPDDNDKRLIQFYEKLKMKFAKMPHIEKGWLTNKNWVITTPMETGIAPRTRAISLLDKIRKENVGEYGPYLSAVEKQAMMTISTGVQAVSESAYGRTDEAMWYVDKIVQTFNRKLPGSISEMMPDYGCFTIAWTSYGIVLPLIQHVFGIQPDAINKTVVFDPHLPTGWEDISIENLPVGNNIVSFSRSKISKGIEYAFTSKEEGWNMFLKLSPQPGAKYYLNGKQVALDGVGFQMTGKNNTILVSNSS